jgi:hypothetical protein
MKFDSIDSTIPSNKAKKAERRFQETVLELGVRIDNPHVGTGMGGNPFQLMTLMSLEHELMDEAHTTIEIKNGKLLWGVAWMDTVKRLDIRKELDAKFPAILEAHPHMFVPMDYMMKNAKQFPKLQPLRAAFNLCSDLADDLDKGVRDSIVPTGAGLANFPMEVNLMAIRGYIQIERIIRHNLDEHPAFEKLFKDINRFVE